jgi:ABC-type transport system involved in multi-copper enzyme maturation permease subunit
MSQPERPRSEPAAGGARPGGQVLSGWAAAWLQAGWSARRLVRGRVVWVACAFALGPIGVAIALDQSGRTAEWDTLFRPLRLLCAIVVPLFAATATADEIEERTYTYLWSRPLPRWSVLVGKLWAAAPIAAALLCVAALVSFQLGRGAMSPQDPWPATALPRALAAVSLAALALSMVSAGIAVLTPRHGLGVAYAYLVVLDFPVGAMPFSIANLSTSHHILVVGGLVSPGADGSAAASVVWLLGIGLFWLLIGLWRISRSEFAGAEK